MSYMVLECHPGYAVVMDEDGRFLKVANRKYTVGQTLTEVVQMQIPQERKKQKWLTPLLTMAACLALVLGITLPRSHQPYASVYVKINPEVRIDVDRQDMVVGLEGVNDDGAALIANYAYQNKHLDVVTDELVDKAIVESRRAKGENYNRTGEEVNSYLIPIEQTRFANGVVVTVNLSDKRWTDGSLSLEPWGWNVSDL